MVGKAQKSHGAISELNSVFGGTTLEHPNMKRELRGMKFRSDAACFREVVGAL
jgi:hypothetical protein